MCRVWTVTVAVLQQVEKEAGKYHRLPVSLKSASSRGNSNSLLCAPTVLRGAVGLITTHARVWRAAPPVVERGKNSCWNMAENGKDAEEIALLMCPTSVRALVAAYPKSRVSLGPERNCFAGLLAQAWV